jgi:succinoglycan biosynthesis protein ExoA
MPSVSIIVPCYNEQETIRQLLEAIDQQTYPREDMEVVIADSFSSDNTLGEIKTFQTTSPGLKITFFENGGHSIPSALNAAIKASRGEYIIRMDAHCIPIKDYVRLCVENQDAGLGDIVGGVWEIKPKYDHWICRSIASAAAHPLGAGNAKYRIGANAGEADTVPFGSFKREVVERIGGYDEKLLSNEDYEFNTRLRKGGGKIYLDPAIRSVYFPRSSFRELARQYWRYGFWKSRMLRSYPETLLLRQAASPLFVLSLAILAPLSIFWNIARLIFTFEMALYAFIVFLGAIKVAGKQRDPSLLFGFPIAILTMHIFWGSGFLWSAFQGSHKE